jgi:hypothetical protein
MPPIDLGRCKQDLLMIGSYTIQQIPCPYNLTDPWEESFKNVYSDFKLKSKERNRIMTMVYCYYLGELIDLTVTPREKWLEFVRTQQIQRESHYYTGITRMYKLFSSNMGQIYRTSYISYRKVVDMRATQFNELIMYGQTVNEIIEGS